jgi:predicted RNA-binding protein with PIN domain
MSLRYAIDGYNVIKHPLFTQQAAKKTQDSRISLLELIRINRLCGSSKNQITVVFDGYPDSRYPGYSEHIEVIFSRKETADDTIKRLVQEWGNFKNTVVVSEDKEIKFFVRSYGVKVEDVAGFFRCREKAAIKSKELVEPQLSYTQMHKIDEELRRIWLK